MVGDAIKQCTGEAFGAEDLVLVNLGVHHCKPVKQWLAEHDEQIEVFYLPSYSPELNPDERLNAASNTLSQPKSP